ncbi:hypothetical protein GN956_G2425 [Arapaima gigas]
MADVIFMLGLTLTLLLIVIVNIQLNKQARATMEDEEKERQKKREIAAAAMGTGGGGMSLHLTTEEMEKNESRLYELFSHRAALYQKTMMGPPKSPSEAPKRPAGPRPTIRKAALSSESEVPKAESEQILAEIEQAVREAH